MARSPDTVISPKSDQEIDPSGCPVRAVGHRDNIFFYLSAGGELIALSASAHTRQSVLGLFLGDSSWLEENFPVYDEGVPRPGRWSLLKATEWLFQQTAKKGIFDSDTVVRRLGVWHCAVNDVVVHVGDRLLTPFALGWTEQRVGEIIGKAIYVATRKIQPPAEEPATASEGIEVLRGFQLWQWEDWAPVLAVGWIAQGILGGWIRWRAHLCVVGPHGVGKSWIAIALQTALTGDGHGVHNNVTEAGLRQRLSGEALPIVIDEQEGAGSSGFRTEKIIELIRQMSGGDGATTLRGTSEGKARSSVIAGAVCIVAINPPAFGPQDRSRISLLQLRPLPTGECATGNEKAVLEFTQRLAELSSRIRARVIMDRHRFLKVQQLYHVALVADGNPPRVADQYATLLAGAFVMTSDGVPDNERVVSDLILIQPALGHVSEPHNEVNEGQECLLHLLSATPETSGLTVGELIRISANKNDIDADVRLQRTGCRVTKHNTEAPYLVVANSHAGLEHIFKDTNWGNKRWRTALRYIDGSMHGAGCPPLRFAGTKQRGIWLPLLSLPLDLNQDE